MTLATALALSLSVWSQPGLAPCLGRCSPDFAPTAESEICDGDLILNTGYRNGEPVGPFLQLVALDEAHLREQDFRFSRTERGLCLPTLTDGRAHLIEACGNYAIVLSADSISGLVYRSNPYMRGGSPSVGPRTGGGASAHVAPSLLPSAELPSIYEEPIIVVDYEPTPAPPPIVPLPHSSWLLLSALSLILLTKIERRTA
jgi:hypothetical protein